MARPRSDIDVRIMHAARARFLREGVDGASLRGIAEDAGTSVGMVYYYFPTKDALFLAVVEEVYERVLADFAAALAPDVPVPARLVRLYARVGCLSEDELVVIRLVVREALVSSSRLDSIIARFRRGHIPLVLATVAVGRADGDLNPAQSPLLQLAAIVGIGIVPQVVARIIAPRLGETAPVLAGPPETGSSDGDSGEDRGRALVDLLLHGVGSRRPGGKTPSRPVQAKPAKPRPTARGTGTRARRPNRSSSGRPSR